MKNSIYYVTGNNSKFQTGQHFLEKFGIHIEQKVVDVQEIQSDNIEEIAIDKAEKAFKLVKAPLFVNDSGWFIEALNGFPGPFMKFLNHWFTAEDFINLMSAHENKKIVFRQAVVYKDSEQVKVFVHDAIGEMLTQAKGNTGVPSDQVISMSTDGKSIAEKQADSVLEIEEPLWKEFADWIKQNG